MSALLIEDRTHWPALRERLACTQPRDASDRGSVAEWLNSRYVHTHIEEQFHRLTTRVEMQNRGFGQCRWIGVDAPAGAGKTELVARWALSLPAISPTKTTSSNPSQARACYDQVPVIWVLANETVEGPGLIHEMLDFCGVPAVSGGTRMRSQLKKLLPQLGTRFIVVDEANTLKVSRNMATANTCRGTLHLPVTMIYIGAGLSRSALMSRADGPLAGVDQPSDQMRKRHEAAVLTPLSITDAQHRAQFTGYIAKFVEYWLQLDGTTAPFVRDARLLQQMHQQTGGYVGPLMELLKSAATAALSDDGAITVDLVRAHWPEPTLQVRGV